jgi:nucleotide-binding universal stress UspA family protein
MSLQVKVDTFTEAGDPKETICNAVQKYEINLLVMGGQANRTFMRLVRLLISI